MVKQEIKKHKFTKLSGKWKVGDWIEADYLNTNHQSFYKVNQDRVTLRTNCFDQWRNNREVLKIEVYDGKEYLLISGTVSSLRILNE